MKEEKKEKWKNKILESVQDIKKAEPPTDLYPKILNKIQNNQGGKENIIQIFPQMRLIAAAVILLALCNFVVIYRYLQQETTQNNPKNYLNISYDLNFYTE